MHCVTWLRAAPSAESSSNLTSSDKQIVDDPFHYVNTDRKHPMNTTQERQLAGKVAVIQQEC
jgi:hypothetical protein